MRRGRYLPATVRPGQIAGVEKDLAVGAAAEEVFPYIPFYQAMRSGEEVPARVTKLLGVNVTIAVMPVLRQNQCIGAFAVMQRFNEMESRQNELRNQLLKKGHMAKYTIDDVLGESDCIRRTRKILLKMAATESPVLIVGETGTGKELLAHSVHSASRRAAARLSPSTWQPCRKISWRASCSATRREPSPGRRRGDARGFLNFAHKGTLFLDEVEGMSPAMQVKLLRVLQEGEVMRVGGGSIVHVDVRIVAATNESLEQMVEEGSFRRDLYYRLNAPDGGGAAPQGAGGRTFCSCWSIFAGSWAGNFACPRR